VSSAFFSSLYCSCTACVSSRTDIELPVLQRKDIPADIEAGKPDPSKWGIPRARFDATSCDMTKYFASQSIVFDITLGGDWYAKFLQI